MKQTISLLVLLLVCLVINANGARETVDKIIAIVGDEVILASELANQIQITALQTKVQPKNSEEMLAFQESILDQMISDKMFLLAARDDTLISVREEEIEEMLEQQVARISQNFDNYDDFLDALVAEGLTIRELKKKYRTDVENQLLKQRFIQSKLYTVQVSKREVEEYYADFGDSIPPQPEAVQMSHILLSFKPSLKVVDSVQALATQLRQMVLEGADFAEVSTDYSSSGAGANGGDLGYLSSDDVVPEFARAAFNLKIGDISGVVQTQFGFHVIKCEGIKGESYKLRHILLAIPPSASDTINAETLADSLMQLVQDEGEFDQLAKTYSDDDNTRAQGGELGWFAVAQLPAEFTETVVGWKVPGEIRGPVKTQYGLHIIKLLDYLPEKKFNLTDDFDRIKEMARQDKTGRIIDKWIEEEKAKVYIQVNVDFNEN